MLIWCEKKYYWLVAYKLDKQGTKHHVQHRICLLQYKMSFPAIA
jgi:hypothetical protein